MSVDAVCPECGHANVWATAETFRCLDCAERFSAAYSKAYGRVVNIREVRGDI